MIPLVSAIMPTRGRSAMAACAVNCFLRQDYPHRELIVLDDTQEPSFQDGLNLDGIQYARAADRSIADKRNRCCEMAQGEIIVHFDSDDWSAPERISDEVKRLKESGLAVTGYHIMLFHREDGQVLQYRGPQTFALGTSLCYLKSWWQQNRFREDRMMCEDNRFVTAAQKAKQIICADAGQLMVARIHGGNTSAKPTERPQYRQMSRDNLPKGFPLQP